jgi:RNA ligase
MKYILNTLHLLNKIKQIYNFEEETYTEFVRSLRHLESITLDETLKAEIIDYLDSLNIQHLKSNIAHILCPDIPIIEIDEEYIENRTLYDLNDIQLINYLGSVIWTVSFNESDDMLLLKYNQCVFNTGWHNLAKECRGKVLNKNTFEIISYPFDKFFNLGEVDETNEIKIKEYISKARKVYVADKKDGSTIIVSNHKGNRTITTNGGFDNIQIELAKKIFEEKYNKFYNSIPEGFTYIFELIHPDNRIVVDYGDEEKLCLLAVRDLSNFKLLLYEDLIKIAEEYELDLVESEDFKSLDEMVALAREMKDANKEGWVLRLVGDDFDIIFKLKLQEYFLLHRSMCEISLKKVYSLIQSGGINNLLDTVDDNKKIEILEMIEEINICRTNIKNQIVTATDDVLLRNNTTREEVLKDKEMFVKVITNAFKHPFGSFIVNYLKNPEGLDYSISKIPTKKFLKFFEEQFGKQ